jgi:hypothetical protein
VKSLVLAFAAAVCLGSVVQNVFSRFVVMSTVESEAAFSARALSIGLHSDVLKLLRDGGLDTFGKYAYSSAYTPGSSDEKPFVQLLTTILGRDPTVQELAVLRRLYFESHALSVADLRTRVESRDEDQPKKMAAPERTSRLEAQKLTLLGINISGANEPANCLVDKCVQMLEDGQLKYLPVNECPSRTQEVLNQKKEPAISFDSSGMIKLSKRDLETKADVSSELKVQQALLRRALAFDQANLISFGVLNSWTTRMFEVLSFDPPAGYRRVSMEQLMNADKELFLRSSEVLRSDLVGPAGAAKPADAVVSKMMDDPRVQYLLLPLPLSSSSSTAPVVTKERPAPYPQGDAKGGKGSKGAGKTGKKGKLNVNIPDGCSTRDGKNRPICFNFNQTGCSGAKPGGRCRRGMHVCWKTGCGKANSFDKCNH